MSEIHDAAKKGDLGKVRELLEKGANVNELDGRGRTPVRIAARYGFTEVWNYLRQHGGRDR